MPASSAVTRSTLRQQIAEALRDEVLGGRLVPGQEFTVKEIAEQYGVSATPVREALVDLSAQGLLDSVQHRGFRVHEFSLADFRGMVEARSLITDAIFHGYVAREKLAAAGQEGLEVLGAPPSPSGIGAEPDEKTRGALLSSVRRRGEEAQRAALAGDLNVLIGYDLRFWREVSTLFGNPYLTDFLGRLRLLSWACAVPLLRQAGELRGRLWAGHPHLVDALARRDIQTAQVTISQYNAQSLALIESLSGEDTVTAPEA
ncbi:GntR family transcriptional regulator [Streptomyces physcomitrii]|uniref:GntR family transcriptional regulator n=1 Tax=Streptomyces physcomitrii TaxID=2724184 RepID=A0ABX1H013_9ACTN|nr:GntR family transcriptional regulator [Streptomyces physcomitrii]NKI41697.1 GntR family transcriptional regulator [Streptomyces physcomitrii]